MISHQIDGTFIDSKYPGFVELCQHLTKQKSHPNRIPYYDKIYYPVKNHHLDFIHFLDETHQLDEIQHFDKIFHFHEI